MSRGSGNDLTRDRSRLRAARVLLEEIELAPREPRPAKAGRVEIPFSVLLVQTQAPRGQAKALREQIGDRTSPGHARAELRVIETSASALPDQAQDPLGSIRDLHSKPGIEQLRDLARQTDEQAAGTGSTRCGGALQDAFQIHIRQARDQRRDQNADRHAGLREPPHDLQASLRRGRPRLQPTGQVRIEARHRDLHRDQSKLGHRDQQVQIAQDQGRFRGDGDRMAAVVKDLEHGTRRPESALDRLVGIRVGPQHQGRGTIARGRQLLLQLTRSIRLPEETDLEIQTGRQTQPGMGRARVAVDATVLATAVGIHRAIERDIGRLVVADETAARIHPDLRAQRRGWIIRGPTVILRLATLARVPRVRIAGRTPSGGVTLRACTGIAAPRPRCHQVTADAGRASTRDTR
ncbi:hypothetical protein THIOKS1100004 [Thiocapsa sp. KS1]|nr:hypothetical protein THIOKS1100004 [Thiocapsa sp. KS1]